MEKNIIALAGPPCSGKTSAGRLLSVLLRADFIDTDRLIQTKHGHTVEYIFRIEGEAAFRAMERECISRVVSSVSRNTILSLGGGSLLDHSSMDLLQANAILFTLRASPETLIKRNRGKRPLAADPEQMISLMNEREAHYSSLGRIISTEALTPSEVAAAIAAVLKEEGHPLWFPEDLPC